MLLIAMAALPLAAQTAPASSSQSKNSTPAAASATKSSAPAAATENAAGKIDINSASKEELMKLSGIGDAISAKIIANRPYKTKRDLLTKKIVNQSTYDKITDKIIAHAAKAATTTAKSQ